MRSLDPFLVDPAQRAEQPGHAAGQQHRGGGGRDARPERQPQHRRQIGGFPPMRLAMLEPTAAMASRPSRPRPRSISTTVVASVFEPACAAVSRIRMTSPPMLLGRKLLKNVATRYELSSQPIGTRTCWASSSSLPAPCARPASSARYSSRAAASQAGGRVPDVAPQTRQVGAAEQQVQQPDADDDLQQERQRPAQRRSGCRSGHLGVPAWASDAVAARLNKCQSVPCGPSAVHR